MAGRCENNISAGDFLTRAIAQISLARGAIH